MEGRPEGAAEGGEEAEGGAEGGSGDRAQLTSETSSTPRKKYPTKRGKLKLVLTPVKSALFGNVTHKNVSPLKVKKAIFFSELNHINGDEPSKKGLRISQKSHGEAPQRQKDFLILMILMF